MVDVNGESSQRLVAAAAIVAPVAADVRRLTSNPEWRVLNGRWEQHVVASAAIPAPVAADVRRLTLPPGLPEKSEPPYVGCYGDHDGRSWLAPTGEPRMTDDRPSQPLVTSAAAGTI
jgi:hypothetical protein